MLASILLRPKPGEYPGGVFPIVMTKRHLILVLGLALLPHHLSAAPLTIQNEKLQVTYDDASQEFSVSSLPAGKVFISSGILAIRGTALITNETDKIYGSGRAITITDAQGKNVKLLLFPGQPFVQLRETLKNSDSQDQILNKVPILAFTPEPDQLASTLKIRGTGGLYAGDQYENGAYEWFEWVAGKIIRHPYHQPRGSYEWLAVAEAQSRNGLVAGWLSQYRATGVLVPEYADHKLTVEVRTEYGHLRLAPGQTAETETLALGYFDDVRLGLETWADEVARTYGVKLPPQPAGYCTWYSEVHGGSSDEKSLAVLADFIHTNLKPFGMNFVQIDDGWQLGENLGNGPKKNFSGFNPQGPYPSGMKATADHLKADGLIPGLWFIPFAGACQDDWFKDKQDLFVKTKDGKPYDTPWGGTCLDMTNPAAQAYVKGIVSNIVQNWGFTYLKMDAFRTGMAANQLYASADYKEDGLGDAVFFNPNKTNLDALRDGMKLVRETAGPDVFFLGCTAAQNMRTYGGSFGLVDAMRIGADNAGDWVSWVGTSPLAGSRNYFLNGRVWYNDPDPCYVRSTLSLDEARTTASWSSISGQLYSNGDWLPGLPPDRLEILKRTAAPHGKTARPVDFMENDPPRVWQVIDDKGSTRRDVVALYNWEDTPLKIDVPLASLDLPKAASYAAFDFWGNAFLPPVQAAISSTLAPHSCLILAVRPMLDHPFVLSTSRHVTQGMIDLTDETWDPATRTLSGKSRIIAGDPYELRIVTPDPAGSWKITRAAVDDSSKTAGAVIVTSADKGLRATIMSSTDETVSWRLFF